MEVKLDQYINILREHNISPTFPITAEILKRHPHIIEKYLNDGVEFAIHGFQHIDYSNLSEEELSEHLGKSVDLFKKNNITFSGFRFPYLKFNEKCMDALSRFPIKWDSSHSIYWDVVDNEELKGMNLRNYQNMLNQYNYRSSSNHISLPRYRGNLLEIPVSLPDDDLLERGGLENNGLLIDKWRRILEETHSRGELFTLQLHPERISVFKKALTSLIQRSRELDPKVWIPRLGDICKWWEEKRDFSVKLNKKSEGVFEVDVKCSPRATLLVRSHKAGNEDLLKGFSVVKGRKFVIKSPKYPIIGVPVGAPVELVNFLKNEGFIFELSENREQFSVYLNNVRDFSVQDEMRTLDVIRDDTAPLIRFWRWPAGYRSTLVVSGDIDGLSSLDFFVRLSS
jgi:peptidoglycan/xylan/chitin deacetylase (PgdA/CDA1 family)